MHRTIRSLSVRFENCSIRNTRKIFSKCGTPPPSNVGISKPVINTSNLLEDINADQKDPGNIEKRLLKNKNIIIKSILVLFVNQIYLYIKFIFHFIPPKNKLQIKVNPNKHFTVFLL